MDALHAQADRHLVSLGHHVLDGELKVGVGQT